MRYYKIKITDGPNGKPMTLPSLAGSGLPPGEISSLRIDNKVFTRETNPASLNIELDMPQYQAHLAGGSTSHYIRIWGVGIDDLTSAFDFNGHHLELEVGMSEGYPFATPSQRGLVVKGTILQAFGNWLGTDMTLDFYLRAEGSGSDEKPVNYTLIGRKGDKLADVLRLAITKANPNTKPPEMNVRPDRVLKADEASVHLSLTEFAIKVKELTEVRDATGKVTDEGVVITAPFNGTIRIYEADGSQLPSRPAPKKIQFWDLLGQVTWAEPGMLTAKLVMRGDLNVGDWVIFPDGLSTVAAPAFSNIPGTTGRLPGKLTFSGTFIINQIHHWGNFRQPDAMSWNTTVWARPAPKAGLPTGGSATGGGLG
jgi:hypothetical protein